MRVIDAQGRIKVTGIIGDSGYSGFSGIHGISGWSGVGFSGWSGTSGWSGVIGVSGWSGSSGQSGTSAWSGISAWSGVSGWTGTSGVSGSTIFGNNPQYASNDVGATTTSSTYQTGVTLTTPALTGTYWIQWSAEGRNATGVTADLEVRFQNTTDAATINEYNIELKDVTNYIPFGGIYEQTFTGAAKSFEIQFASENNSDTVGVRRARIMLWRKA